MTARDKLELSAAFFTLLATSESTEDPILKQLAEGSLQVLYSLIDESLDELQIYNQTGILPIDFTFHKDN